MSQNAVNSLGLQSVRLPVPVYIRNSASVVGKKEGDGPLGLLFDMVGEDDMFGCESWEDAESSLQKDAVYLALGKAKLKPEDMKYIFAGDLLGQSIATSFGIMNFGIPLLGVYGACSTCGESLSLGAMAVAAGYAENVVCVTSSHFASAEKEFRFPLAYGNLDGNGQRRFCFKHPDGRAVKGGNHRHYNRKNCGLRTEGFHEYGTLHGACGGVYHSAAFCGLEPETGGL